VQKVFTLVMLALCILIALPQRMFSQSSASVVEGMVQDATGAVIQNCDVNLLSTETGESSRHTRTKLESMFFLPSSLGYIRWRFPSMASSHIL